MGLDGSTYRRFADVRRPPVPHRRHPGEGTSPADDTIRVSWASGGRNRMIRFRVALIGCGLLLMASSAAAQIVGRPFEVSAQGGWVHYDTRTDLKGGPGVTGTL